MPRLIVITSGKGGVGKTTSAVNLGAAINYFGGESLVVDANLTTPNIGLHLGSPIVPINLNHVLIGKADLEEAIYEHESGTKILPSSLSIKDLKKIKTEKLKDLSKDLKAISEYVIVDSAAGLGDEAVSAIKMADELIIVTNPEMPAITDALKTIKLAEEMKKSVRGVIINRVKKNRIEMSPETVKEMLEVPILGMIPEDEVVQESINLKNAVVYTHPRSKVARAYKEIAAKIIGIKYDSKKDSPSFWERLFG
ncbi:MAG: cell division ATPase MinD [Nanoarchaeota archaeon]